MIEVTLNIRKGQVTFTTADKEGTTLFFRFFYREISLILWP